MRKATIIMAVLALALAACGDDAEPEAALTTTTKAVAAVQAVTTTTNRAPVATTIGPATSSCEPVGFTPDSEDVASDIRATGLSCAAASAFVRAAGQVTSSGGPQEVHVEGYHCVRTATYEEPLPRSSYECTDGARTVTFVRS